MVSIGCIESELLGDRLVAVREQSHLTLALCFDEMLNQPAARARFICYMIQMYHYVRFACPLMEKMLRLRDRLPPRIVDYLEQNLVEEAGHEQWILEDLERLGFEPDRVQRTRPLRQTASLVGSQYYWMRASHPAVCFGYMFALERTAPTLEANREAIRKLAESLDIGIKALSSLVRHGELDFQHQKDKVELLNSTRLDRGVEENLLQNCRETMLNLCDLFVGIAGLPASQLSD